MLPPPWTLCVSFVVQTSCGWGRPRWHRPRTTLSPRVGPQWRGGSADEPQGPCRGRVYLTPWPDSQSAVRPALTAERGYDLRGHGGSGLTGSSLKHDRDTLALTDSVPVGGAEWLRRLYAAEDIWPSGADGPLKMNLDCIKHPVVLLFLSQQW